MPDLRALGAVLGTLAELRYDAKWLVLRASAVGAPHHRSRAFLTAWPAGHGPAQDPDEQPRV
ncbi:DNA cytosine methyltransferase [Kitasatospora sp. NPDC048545]|uniref:DNA cytosine methyltransferase n=1 Tax=Kitasatospora sp. NPDC048545 TaxID=3157208 RepID=UPI0033E5FB32